MSEGEPEGGLERDGHEGDAGDVCTSRKPSTLAASLEVSASGVLRELGRFGGCYLCGRR